MKQEIIQLDGPIDFEEIKSLTETLLYLTYEEIAQKMNRVEFFRKVFSLNIDDKIILLRDLTIRDFIDNENYSKLTSQQKDKIIEIIAATADQSSLQASLQQINNLLVLPRQFDFTYSQAEAKRVFNALQNIKICIADEGVNKYLFDVGFFLKIDPAKLDNYLAENRAIADGLVEQYEKLIPTGKIDDGSLEPAIQFISRCGRTSIGVTSLQKKHNLGTIAEIISKIERAILIVKQIHTDGLFNPTAEQIETAIRNYIINDTVL
jgi:hypothetical protein